jgi:predicted alpha/beta hydrolase family esterase
MHSLGDDIATVKRAINQISGPITLVGHSYGRHVITNAGSNNLNVTGLVYVATFAPDEEQPLSNLIDLTKLPKDLLIFDNGGSSYLNPSVFHGAFVQDVDPIEADVMAIVQNTVS